MTKRWWSEKLFPNLTWREEEIMRDILVRFGGLTHKQSQVAMTFREHVDQGAGLAPTGRVKILFNSVNDGKYSKVLTEEELYKITRKAYSKFNLEINHVLDFEFGMPEDMERLAFSG